MLTLIVNPFLNQPTFLTVKPKPKEAHSVLVPQYIRDTWRHMKVWCPILSVSLPKAGQATIGNFVMVCLQSLLLFHGSY